MITTRRVNISGHRMMSDYNISRGVCMSWYRDEAETVMSIISHGILVRNIRYYRTRKRYRKLYVFCILPNKFSHVATNYSKEVSYANNT